MKGDQFTHAQSVTDESSLEELRSLLQWLDWLIAIAIEKAEILYGVEAASDSHRGLYVDTAEIERLLAREPGHPLFQANPPAAWKQNARLTWLQQTVGLSDFEIALMLVALAPEIDLRYERFYAYLQDDVTRKRPTVDLALNLLCNSSVEKLQRRQHLAVDAPLVRQQILHVIPDTNQPEPPLLAHILKLDEQIVQFFLGQSNLDRRLEPFCQMTRPAIALAELPISQQNQRFLQTRISQAKDQGKPLRLYLQGVPGIGKSRVAGAIATELKATLLIADLPRAVLLNIEVIPLLETLLREAQLKQAVLYLTGIDQLNENNRGALHLLLEKLITNSGVTILAGTQPWQPTTPYRSGVINVQLDLPEFKQRQLCWKTALSTAGYGLEQFEVDSLANQFRLTPEQIFDAVTQAGYLAQGAVVNSSIDSIALPGKPGLRDFFTAARNQSGHNLQALAQKIEPRYGWTDIVLPLDPSDQLREICDQVKHRQVVYQSWGFERKLSLGKGVTALFSGPPGTGKTMAAEVIAQELQLDLYKIDLSQVVSKYIGETEKNLDRIFTAAETANAILFFDEADALFGKRAEVKDAHDRYANIEVGYLLQKVESYLGLAILATNLRQNLDEAFIRRMQAIVEFPFPDEEFRYRIWQVIIPSALLLHEDVDLALLAREIKLSGGNIKNIALAAAFYAAAAESGILRMEHLVKAAHREHQKLGKNWHFNK
jgi:SpoVK/Ycf46/Vps4 family AAA+-type ATPase